MLYPRTHSMPAFSHLVQEGRCSSHFRCLTRQFWQPVRVLGVLDGAVDMSV